MKPAEQQCLQLLDHVLDGSISEAQREEFSRLLAEHPQLTAQVAEQLRTHSLLLWHYHGMEALGAPRPSKLPLSDALRPRRPVKSLARKKWPWAAVILAAASLSMWGTIRRINESATVAEVVDQHLVEWRKDTTALHDRDMVSVGRLEMKSGTLGLRFRSGATLSVSGDVSMQIDSDMQVRLDRGQVTAHVPQAAKGFTVVTPHVQVVDLGTQFGVLAGSDGITEVVVFRGEVELNSAGKSTVKFHEKLTKGEGVRIGERGLLGRVVDIHWNFMGDQWSTDHPLSPDATIKSVRDNLNLSNCEKFYELIPRGLLDDVPAYVDGPSQWNGLTTAGLPDFLRHADYVKTFNDLSVILDMEVAIELAKPAMVYVFFDRRVSPPKWLTDQFENTGVDIGLDEAWPQGNPDHVVAVGGGQGIDHVFSVWRKKCPLGGTVRLGSAGDKSWHPRSMYGVSDDMWRPRAMYGIAAKPLESAQ